MSSNTLKIVQGIAQAAANAYDGSHDERYAADGKARKIGLNREEGDPILDKRVIDGLGPDGISLRVMDIAKQVSRIQTGYIYHYAFAMLIGLMLFITYFFVRV